MRPARANAELFKAGERLPLGGDRLLELHRHKQVEGTGAEELGPFVQGYELGEPQGLPVVDSGLAVGLPKAPTTERLPNPAD
jgi:hypothetical protein